MIRRPLAFGCNAGVLLALAGCAWIPPGGERAEFLEPPSLQRTLSQAAKQERQVSSRAWPDDQWWRQFRNADLDRIMDIALNENHGLRKASARLSAAEGVAKVEGARLLPFLDADLSMRQSRVPTHGVFAALNPQQGGLEKTAAFINPLKFRYEFDFWGKNRAALESALGEAAAADAEFAEARLLLTSAIARSYFRGLALAQQLAPAQQMTELRRGLLRLAEQRFRSGLDTEDVVNEAAVELETAKKREAVTQAALALQQDLLARLMGDGPDAMQNLFAGKRAAIPARTPLPARLPIELLAHRPDLAAAMHRAEAAAERIHMAKAEFLPSIDLTAAAGLEASVTSTQIGKLGSFLFRPSAFTYQVVPGLQLPWFEGGRLRGRLEARRAEYDEAVELYNETLLDAIRQVADGWANWKQSRALLEVNNRLLASKRRESTLACVRLRSGLGDRREALTREHAFLEQQFGVRAFEADHLSAAVDLIQALGGGYANGVDSSRPQLAPEEALSGVETLTPAWNLESLAPALLPFFRDGNAEQGPPAQSESNVKSNAS